MRTWRLGDTPLRSESDALGCEHRIVLSYASGPRDGRFVRAITTGEKRPPKQGEYYLSGAIPVAYRAPNDLGSAYMICRLVAVKRSTITHEFVVQVA